MGRFIKNLPYFTLLPFFLILPFLSKTEQDFTALYNQSLMKRQPNSMRMATYHFTIETACQKTDLGWRVYYEGTIVTQKGAIFQISAKKNLEEIGVVVAMIQRPDKATIEALEVPKGVNYSYYQFTKAPLLADPKKRGWSIKETHGNEGFKVPRNTIVILLDPQYIKTLKKYSWDEESDIIMLPSIILKNIETLSEASVKTMLTALDTDLLHSRTEPNQSNPEKDFIS